MYLWDDGKRIRNLGKHGVDFAAVSGFEFSSALVRADVAGYDEPRLVAIGLIGPRVHVLVFTIEHRAVRVISLRKANKREIRAYVETV